MGLTAVWEGILDPSFDDTFKYDDSGNGTLMRKGGLDYFNDEFDFLETTLTKPVSGKKPQLGPIGSTVPRQTGATLGDEVSSTEAGDEL